MSRAAWTGLVASAVMAAVVFGIYSFLREVRAVRERQETTRTELVMSPHPVVLSQPAPVPEFELTDANGQPFRRANLEGRVSIVDFIFTRCATSCPAMTARMSALQTALLADPELARSVGLVSFSVDPGHDTPDALAEYAKRNGADPAIWRFATGPEGAVSRLSREGFLLAVGDVPPDAGSVPAPEILHSDRFAVVDSRGRVRAYFPIRYDREHLDEVIAFVRKLVSEGRRQGSLAASPIVQAE